MRKAFKYRIYLTNGQRRILEAQLEECRWVYNQALQARRDAHAASSPLGLYDTINLLPNWNAERPALKLVHSQVSQNISQRVHLAFEAFYRRVKAKELAKLPALQAVRSVRQHNLSAVWKRCAA